MCSLYMRMFVCLFARLAHTTNTSDNLWHVRGRHVKNSSPCQSKGVVFQPRTRQQLSSTVWLPQDSPRFHGKERESGTVQWKWRLLRLSCVCVSIKTAHKLELRIRIFCLTVDSTKAERFVCGNKMNVGQTNSPARPVAVFRLFRLLSGHFFLGVVRGYALRFNAWRFLNQSLAWGIAYFKTKTRCKEQEALRSLCSSTVASKGGKCLRDDAFPTCLLTSSCAIPDTLPRALQCVLWNCHR